MKIGIYIPLLLVAVGCSKGESGKSDSSDQKTAAKAADKTQPPAPRTPPASPFAEFGDIVEIEKKWQGAWVIEAGALNLFQAWEVKGKEVTAFDGKTESTLEFKVLTPCKATVTEHKPDGSKESTAVTFAFTGDTLHTGMGSAGVKKEDKILACVGGKVFVFDGKSCTAWEESMMKEGTWDKSAAECKLDGSNFSVTASGQPPSTLLVEADVVLNEQMKSRPVEKAKDFAEAKAKLAARK